jgi:hypothetical protein
MSHQLKIFRLVFFWGGGGHDQLGGSLKGVRELFPKFYALFTYPKESFMPYEDTRKQVQGIKGNR